MIVTKKLRDLKPGEVSVQERVEPKPILAQFLVGSIANAVQAEMPEGWLVSVNLEILVECVVERTPDDRASDGGSAELAEDAAG